MVAQLIVTALGIWLMAAPDLLHYEGPSKTNHQIVGPLVVTFAFIAVWEVTRGLRWINVAFGAWLAVSAFIQPNETLVLINSLAAGGLIAGLSLVRGALEDRYAGGWRSLWHRQEVSSAAPARARG